MTPEPRGIPHINVKEFKLFDRSLSIEMGVNGSKIPIVGRLAEPDHYTGPLEFDSVVNLEDLLQNSGLRASRVPEEEMWSQANPPPKGIGILEFENSEIGTMVRAISQIATTCELRNSDASGRYYHLVKLVYEAMLGYTDVDPKSTVFLGLLRAGGVAGEMLGVPLSRQVLIETKRLRLKDGNGGNLSIGIDYRNEDDLKGMSGKHWLIADPAGATYSSVLANLALAVESGVRPERVSIWNTVANHKGSMFAIEAMKQMGINGQIVAGGYSPGMNDKYYLETPEGKPSVGDAGDWLSGFLDLNSPIVPKT